MAVGAIALAVCGVAPVALAGADASGTTGSNGNWISATPAGGGTPSYVTPVDTTNHFDTRPVTALNSHGQGVIAWRDNITGDVMASHIEPGHAWSTPEALGIGAQPAAAIDAAGDITVTWPDNHGDLEYSYRASASGGFVSGEVTNNPHDAFNPKVVMDSGGNAWMIWSAAPSLFGPGPAVYGAYVSASALASGGSPGWKAELASSIGLSYSATLATNPSGSAVIAAFPSPDNSSLAIAYAQSGAGSLHTPLYQVPNPGPGGMESPSVAINDAGEAVLAWDECHGSFGPFCPGSTAIVKVASATASQLANPAGVAFTNSQTLPFGTAGAQYRPRVAVNNNEVAVAWNDRTQTNPTSRYAVDGATEPLTNLTSGPAAWHQLDQSILGSDAVSGPRIGLDSSSDVTLVWQTAAPGNGEGTLKAARANACATTCASSTSLSLDSQAYPAGRPALATAPNGDALLTWTSYTPSNGVIPTVVADAYDPGPVLSDIQIPMAATAGTAMTFSVQAADSWTALEGPIVTHWDFGDGTTATGDVVSHTYANSGTYTVTVTADTTVASTTVSTANTTASTTISTQVVVAPAAAPQVQPSITPPSLSGVAAWGGLSKAHAVSAEVTVPALSCAGNTASQSGQELGARLWGSGVTPLADFAGVTTECRHHAAVYAPTFTISDISAGTSTSHRPRLHVTAGDLVQVSINVNSGHTVLTLTDLSTPTQKPATFTGPSLAPEAGWQVGAFPVPNVGGPYPTVPIGFTNVTADGKGIGSLNGLKRSSWGSASVSQIGTADNSLSVLFSTVPPAPKGGSLAAPANGSIRYRPPGSNNWKRLKHNTPLPADTVIDATNGTVQVSNPEPHHQNQSVTAWGGEFSTKNNSHGATTINVTGTWGAGASASGARASLAAGHNKKTKPAKGNLWAKGHGKFTTKGNYGAAAVLGTRWLTRNLKHGTLFSVAKNRYDKNDAIRVTVYYPHRHTVVLRQGHSLVAPAPKPKVKPKAKPKPKKVAPPPPPPFTFTLVGATEVNGRYNTPAPGYYELVLTSKTKPYYVDAAVAPLQPGGGGAWFFPDGSKDGVPQWEIHFQLKSSLATFQLWNVGIKLGDKLYVVPLRLKAAA